MQCDNNRYMCVNLLNNKIMCEKGCQEFGSPEFDKLPKKFCTTFWGACRGL